MYLGSVENTLPHLELVLNTVEGNSVNTENLINQEAWIMINLKIFTVTCVLFSAVLAYQFAGLYKNLYKKIAKKKIVREKLIVKQKFKQRLKCVCLFLHQIILFSGSIVAQISSFKLHISIFSEFYFHLKINLFSFC